MWAVQSVPHRHHIVIGRPDIEKLPTVINYLDYTVQEPRKEINHSEDESDLSEAEEDLSEMPESDDAQDDPEQDQTTNEAKEKKKQKEEKVRREDYDYDDPFIDDSEMPDFDVEDFFEQDEKKASDLNVDGNKKPLILLSDPKPEHYYVHFGPISIRKRKHETELEDKVEGKQKENTNKEPLVVKEKENTSSKLQNLEQKLKKSKILANPPVKASKKSEKELPVTKTKSQTSSPVTKASHGAKATDDLKTDDGENYTLVIFRRLLKEYKDYIRNSGGKVDLKEPKTSEYMRNLIKTCFLIPNFASNAEVLATHFCINSKGHAFFETQLLNDILPSALAEEMKKLDENIIKLKSLIRKQINEAIMKSEKDNAAPPPLETQALESSQVDSSDPKKLSWLISLKECLYDVVEGMTMISGIESFIGKSGPKPLDYRTKAFQDISEYWKVINPLFEISPNDIASKYKQHKKKLWKDILKEKSDSQPADLKSSQPQKATSLKTPIKKPQKPVDKVSTPKKTPVSKTPRRLVEPDSRSKATIEKAVQKQMSSSSSKIESIPATQKSGIVSGATSAELLPSAPFNIPPNLFQGESLSPLFNNPAAQINAYSPIPLKCVAIQSNSQSSNLTEVKDQQQDSESVIRLNF